MICVNKIALTISVDLAHFIYYYCVGDFYIFCSSKLGLSSGLAGGGGGVVTKVVEKSENSKRRGEERTTCLTDCCVAQLACLAAHHHHQSSLSFHKVRSVAAAWPALLPAQAPHQLS